MPIRALAAGIRTTSAIAGASAQLATSAATTLTAAGLAAATAPVREGVRILNRELSGVTQGRRCWCGDGRAWIEVHGLDGPQGAKRGSVVLKAVREHAGVSNASLNYPLSRIVIEFDASVVTPKELCDTVIAAEKQDTQNPKKAAPRTRSIDLPGDGLLKAQKLASAAANAAGLSIAVAGRALLLPRLPASLVGAVVAVDYQPRLRRLLEDRFGQVTADTALALVTATAYTLTLAPPSLAVDLAMSILKAAESQAGAREWARREPTLAQHADAPADYRRAAPNGKGPIERHAERAAWAQAIGATALGAVTRNPAMAGTAAMVAAPKGARSAREAFAATLGRGLAEHHGVLTLRPESLRKLDRVDTLLIDPRVLCSNQLRLARIRGVDGHDASVAWDFAQQRLARNGAKPGWRQVGAGYNGAEVLLQYASHPMAAEVIAEARQSGLTIVSVDDDGLGELRPAIDEILDVDGSVDAALVDALATLQQSGKTVAVVSSSAAQALSKADVAMGVVTDPEHGPPPWNADLLLDDLSVVWQVLHAIPAARTATRRGVEIATGASAMGALLMVPGVRGQGPEAVTAGAATGLATGYWLGRRATHTTAPQPPIVHEWHAMSAEQVREMLPQLQTAVHTAGLTERGAKLAAAPGKAVWEFTRAIGTELSDPLTPVLAVGAAASAVLGSPVDAVLVGSVLIGNGLMAAVQRLHSERLLSRLLAEQVPPARIVHEDPAGARHYANLDARQLRPGDLIEVRPDEVVPADARLLEVLDVEVDESSLTGESLPVDKQVAATPGAELAERRCMLFAGTTVMTGTALAVVTAVGADTQARRAAGLVGDTTQSIGLQHQLSQLTTRALPVSLIGGALVSGLGLLRRTGIREAVSSGVAVSVAAVPEGLPLVATLAQQASARRLTRTGALVRTPRAVEALGRIDVVCFDKTGTLSENRLRVTQVWAVPGVPKTAVLGYAGRATPAATDGKHAHATDAAIADAAQAANGAKPHEDALAHLPFRPGRPFSASVTGNELTVKGAPEVLLAACSDADPRIESKVSQLAADGLRVIAVARRRLSPKQIQSVIADPDAMTELCRHGLHIAGLLGLSDTPRPEAAGMLAELAEQQIAVRLITGDHPITAAAIARELGLDITVDQVISGSQWEALSRKGQERAVADRVVFARMSPENKVQIVQTLERTGRICAMVGDGANDAAAIRAATVGIGVVARGSDPAYSAADVVLVDGRIHALLDALQEGRQLWQRVQAAVSVLLGGNAGEVLFAIVGSALTGRAPLNARQLLLVNMLTDALPAAALAVSPPRASAPIGRHGPDEAALWRTVATRGAITATAASGAWLLARFTGRAQRASTVGLVSLVATQLGQTLLDSHGPLVIVTAAGSLTVMAALISTPGVSQLLGCTPLGPVGWAQALGTAGLATGVAAVAPDLVSKWIPNAWIPNAWIPNVEPLAAPTGDAAQSAIFTTPARTNSAYSSRNGGVRTRAAKAPNGSAAGPSMFDTTLSVPVGSGHQENHE